MTRARPHHKDHAKHSRKSKLKQRYKNTLGVELAKSMERAMVLSELICEKRAADHAARVAHIRASRPPQVPPPRPVGSPTPARPTRMNEWGLEL